MKLIAPILVALALAAAVPAAAQHVDGSVTIRSGNVDLRIGTDHRYRGSYPYYYDDRYDHRRHHRHNQWRLEQRQRPPYTHFDRCVDEMERRFRYEYRYDRYYTWNDARRDALRYCSRR